jgi:hypothetical protein
MANAPCIDNMVSTVVFTRNVISTGTSDNSNYMATVTVRDTARSKRVGKHSGSPLPETNTIPN